MTPRSPGGWTRRRGLWGSGEGGTAEDRLEGLRDRPRSGRPRRFPPEQVAAVKAAACEMPIRYGLPLSRFSGAELHRLVIELYFSILQRKALNPNDLATLDALAERLLGFAEHYRQIARPFEWAFTRQDRNALLARIERHELSSPWPHNRQKLRARLLGPVGLGGDDGELGASSVLDVSRELPLEFWPPDGAALRWRWAAPRPGRAAGAATTPTRVGVPVVSVLPPRRQLADEENDSQRHEYRRDGRYRPGDRRASGRCPDVRNEGGGLDMRQIDPVHRR